MSVPATSGRTTCPVCGRSDAVKVIEFGELPAFCNVFWPTPELARGAATGSLHLSFCRGCGMLWNATFDDSLVGYGGDFENSLHYSETFLAYVGELVERLIERYDIRGKTIVDIGCGQGEFLRMICAAGGNRGVGFDPASDGVDDKAANVRFVKELYTGAAADVGADLVTCRHVLEHIEDPRRFMEGVRRAMSSRPDAVLYVEVPSAEYMLDTVGVWDVIYEHCSFYTAPALERLLELSGFDVVDIRRGYGAQYLSAEAVPAKNPPVRREFSAEVNALALAAEEFATRAGQRVAEAEGVLRAHKGGHIALWGAGSKGVTFLNLVGPAEKVACVVDVNPRKQGQYVAGAAHPIIAPASLLAIDVETVLVTNPLYRGEIAARLADEGTNAEVVSV